MDKPLKQRLVQARRTQYVRRKRTLGVHERIRDYISSCVNDIVNRYDRSHEFEGAFREQLRHLIRTYHNYVIKHNFRAHYCDPNGGSAFEHAIPMQQVIDLLLSRSLTVREAIDSPTALVSQQIAGRLKQVERKHNDDPYYPFRRYLRAAARIQNLREVTLITPFSDLIVDLDTWTLDDHYRLVDRLWRDGDFKEKNAYCNAAGPLPAKLAAP